MHLGLIGYGTIASALSALLSDHTSVTEVTVLIRPGREKSVARRIGETIAIRSVTDVAALLAARPDLIVECAGHDAVKAYVPKLLRAGIDTVVVSVGALADATLAEELRMAAVEGGARIVLPAGAVGGIDILSALAAAGPLDVRYTGTKPPAAWAGTPVEAALDLSSLSAPANFFEGTAREAASAYPKNANVAATLALAGAGFDQTRVSLAADPDAAGNTHDVEISSPAARIRMRIDNVASGNAKTSLSTVYSVLREIRNRQGPVVI